MDIPRQENLTRPWCIATCDARLSPLRFAVGLIILAVFGGVVYLEDRGIINLSEVSEQTSAPATRTARTATNTSSR